MFIVICDHPKYPYIQYCKTFEEAEAKYNEAIAENEDKDGDCVCKIAIAVVVKLLETKSLY